jgi:uncharacterized protein (UPF0332 family)
MRRFFGWHFEKLFKLEQMSPNTWQTLSQLRSYRVRADYDLDVEISEQEVRDAINRLDAYIHECRTILGVS